jgi:hypothetical protein
MFSVTYCVKSLVKSVLLVSVFLNKYCPILPVLKYIFGFRHMIFYDMGAQDTTATVVGYQIVKTKERGFAETHPQVSKTVENILYF